MKGGLKMPLFKKIKKKSPYEPIDMTPPKVQHEEQVIEDEEELDEEQEPYEEPDEPTPLPKKRYVTPEPKRMPRVKKKVWTVKHVAVQTNPVIVNEDTGKEMDLYEALTLILNNLE